jgi:TorA maturation chaperone TorD
MGQNGPAPDDVLLDISRSRSALYQLLSELTLFPPRAELVETLRGGELRGAFSDLFSPETLTLLREIPPPDHELLQSLNRDFHRLFQVPGDGYTKPYEAVYTDQREVAGEVVGGLLMGGSTVEVQKLYDGAGLRLSADVKELPDHIGVELAFMSFLCSQEAEARQSGDGKGLGVVLQKEVDFLREHLARWTRDLCTEIRTSARTGFSKAVAAMLEEFVQADLEGIESLVP